jgi:hypothetical protein
MLDTSHATSLTDDGVTFGNEYWYYVTAMFSGGESPSSDTVSAMPFDYVVINTFPHQEGFESGAEWPAGWWTMDYNAAGGIYNWHMLDTLVSDPTYVHSGQYSAASMWNGSIPSDEYLVSPVFDLSVPVEQMATLNFWFGYNTTWLGATLHVFGSDDRGATWDTLWTLDASNGTAPWGWTNATVDLDAYAGDEVMVAFVYSGLDGDLVCVDDITVDFVTSIDEDGSLPTTFDIAQNYPNPFNPSTHIKYQLPQNSNVTIKVYNSIGQVVKTLVNNSVEAGYHEVVWDGTNDTGVKVSSGVYIYRMTTAHFVKSHKLILMK